MKSYLLIPSILLLAPAILSGQKIDHTSSFRDMKSGNYLRSHYENDFFATTDYDYSQGVNFELTAPGLQKNPVNYILISPKKSERRYGISIEHLVYTPDSLSSYYIQYGKRPYAAAYMLKSFSIAIDTIHKSRITSSLSIGLIGPGAGGGNMQKLVHKITGSDKPNGWYYQIKNDLVLNYDVTYEKQLLRLQDYFSLSANTGAKLGTLFTNASLGLNATLGLINSPFTSFKNTNRFQCYIFSQPLANFIAYDATLQGGLINDKSPYTIESKEIRRITLQNNFGIVIQYRQFYLEYAHTLLTREISTARSHSWGGVRFGFKL